MFSMCLEKFFENMQFDENNFYYLVIHTEKLAKSWFFEVLDMLDLQSAQNDSKSDKNVNFKVLLENSNLNLHFDIGFGGIRSLEQFLYDFEIWSWNHDFSIILRVRWKKLYPSLIHQ